MPNDDLDIPEAGAEWFSQARLSLGFDTEICLGCGRVGPKPPPPAISCCPEREPITLTQVATALATVRKLKVVTERIEEMAAGGRPVSADAIAAEIRALSQPPRGSDAS